MRIGKKKDTESKPLPVESDLTVTDFELIFRFPRWVPFPPYPIIVIRGILGFALIEHFHPGFIEMPMDMDDLVFTKSGRFNRAIPADSEFWKIFKPGDKPYPFLIIAESGGGMGNKLRTALRFFGRGIKYAAICFEALKDYPYKLFSNRGFRFRLEAGRVTEKRSLPWEREWKPANDGTVPVEMLTPAKLKYRNKQLMPDGPLLHTFVWAAVRRLRSLSEAYGKEYSENREKIEALIDRSDITRVSIRMAEESYVSSVSGKSIDLSGITGWFETEGPEGIERLLRIAEYVGIGQKTAQGNGRVRIRNPLY